MRLFVPAALGSGLGVVLALACNVEPDASPQFASHCGDVSGDSTCAVSHPRQPFCNLCVPVEEDEGCVDTPPVPACRPGGGGVGGDGGTDDGEGTSTGDAETGTDDDTSGGGDTLAADDTGTSSSTGGEVEGCLNEGAFDEVCEASDPERPFCIEGACSSCGDAGGDLFCGEVDTATPACDLVAGGCVACFDAARAVCGASQPVCDTVSGSCAACSTHDDCPESACHVGDDDPLLGACFLPEEVIWVDGTAACPGAGTEDDPTCSLTAAVNSVDEGESAAIFLVAGDPYDEDVQASVAATIAIRGVGSPSIVSEDATAQPSLDVRDGARVYLSNVRLNDNTSESAIECRNASVVIDDVEIADNGRWAVFTTGPCAIDIGAARVHHNTLGGVRMLGGMLSLDNAAIGANGNGSAGPGVQLFHADIDAVYSTIAGNDGFGPDTLQCEGDVGGSVRNSILHGADPESVELDCFSLTMDFNAVDSSSFGSGTNTEIGAFVGAYFSDLSEGVFTLGAPPLTPYGGVAQWQKNDPRFDADGTARPLDEAGYAGVDQPE